MDDIFFSVASSKEKPEEKEKKKNEIIRFQPPSKEKVKALREYR